MDIAVVIGILGEYPMQITIYVVSDTYVEATDIAKEFLKKQMPNVPAEDMRVCDVYEYDPYLEFLPSTSIKRASR
jgi:hypothetical protein